MTASLFYLPLFFGVLWKSSVVLGSALAICRLLEKGSASLRRLVLSTAVASLFLAAATVPVMPRLTLVTPDWFHRERPRTPTTTVGHSLSSVPQGIDAASDIGTPSAPLEPVTGRIDFRPWLLPLMLFLVAGTLLVRFALNLHRLRRLRIASQIVTAPDIKEHAAHFRRKVQLLQNNAVAAPVTWGTFRPVILLPPSMENLQPECRAAVLDHEYAHIQGYDFFARVLAEIACAVLWFQPLIWVVSRRLREEQELACDDYVLTLGGRASQYARLLLEWNSTSGRDALVAIGMAHRNCLKKRIQALLDPHLRREAVSSAGTVGVWVLAILSALPLAALNVTTSTPAQPARPKLLLHSLSRVPETSDSAVQFSQVQPPHVPVEPVKPRTPATVTSAPPPKFDVASIRACQPGDGPGRSGKGDMGANRGVNPNMPEGVGGYFRASPGRLDITCASVLTMVYIAYVEHGTRLLNNPGLGPLKAPEQIKGIPKWALAARYTIHAETDAPAATGPTRIGEGPGSRPGPAQALLYGPMLQSLLEDRFQLKVHRETGDAPMYALTVAKGGLKIKPLQDGDCIPDGPPEWPAGGKPMCNWEGWDTNGPDRRLLLGGVSLGRLAETLSELILDRNVIDRTGITGSFIGRLEYAPDENTRCFGPPELCAVDLSSDIPPGPTIFGALQEQFGLRLESIKGPQEHMVIDRVATPSEN